MTELKDIIAYYCKKYPHKAELSKARLTKMVYLADWKSALERSKQISDIKWVYNHYGPYVDDVTIVAQTDKIFDVESTHNVYGGNKEIVRLKSDNYQPSLTNTERNILDHIVTITASKYWNPFMELVYSTYPVMTSSKHSELNLVELAKDYKAMEASKMHGHEQSQN